ncbi:hypothetical protein EVAR_76624_1 [Eumeta japonica]|uniref:Uncharacterized protein n=1 Tax=Eumeta variegata TaxID=151549 RepID=A0A4C1T7X5_EUMVA|nr:hypothetical protein EVAR_76624_1 [Eumeta japonica]
MPDKAVSYREARHVAARGANWPRAPPARAAARIAILHRALKASRNQWDGKQGIEYFFPNERRVEYNIGEIKDLIDRGAGAGAARGGRAIAAKGAFIGVGQ